MLQITEPESVQGPVCGDVFLWPVALSQSLRSASRHREGRICGGSGDELPALGGSVLCRVAILGSVCRIMRLPWSVTTSRVECLQSVFGMYFVV